MNDLIIREVWKAKDENAARHGHDVRRMAEYLRRKEQGSGHAVVNLRDRIEKKRKTNV
ncbi:MAG TPA: hypothetical protein PKE12_00150 [Kiritimatiellia bacterium]|nr:hypothetical protein [Kiritimatiellia bacterium]